MLFGMQSRGSGTFVALLCVVSLLSPVLAEGGRRRKAARRTSGKPAVPAPAGARPGSVDAGTRGAAEEHVHVRRGDSLARLLWARGVSRAEAEPWLTAAGEVYDLRLLRPRRGLSLRFDRATHELQAIRYEIDDRSLLVLARTPDGVIEARRTVLPYFTEVKGIAVQIERGLREDAGDSGVPPRVISEMADIFGWDIDLDNDLRPGDEFRILYENIWQAGEARAEPGKVLGAEILASNRPTIAVFFEDADGRGGYYRPTGDPLARAFLRYPVEFTEVTSEFSLNRRHPILRVGRPHLGVDFAAPVGTPVRAVASGMVTYSGWANRLGRCVRIDHTGTLASSYGHLARIAAGIAPGTPVERGRVIGYVGASGLATGPHLHFALHRDGEYIDPLSLAAAPDEAVPEPARRAFERVQTTVTRQLAALPLTANPTTVSLFDNARAARALAE